MRAKVMLSSLKTFGEAILIGSFYQARVHKKSAPKSGALFNYLLYRINSSGLMPVCLFFC